MKTSENFWAAIFVSSLLSACGGGGGGGDSGSGATPTPTPVTTPTPTPTPGNCDDTGDDDGDGLLNCLEVVNGTHPDIADTDGDGFLDKEEVDNWDRNGGNHLRFNPLVADVPRIRVQQLSRPVIQLYATTEESGEVTKGMKESDFAETELTTTRGRTNTHRVEEQHTVNVNAEVQKRGPITSGSVSASYEYQHTDTTTDTTYWNETQIETNRRESSEYFEIINSETVRTQGGEIKVLMGLLNDGDVSYTLNNMSLTAFREDPSMPGSLIPVGTLRHDGLLSFTPNPLGPNPDISDSDFTPFTFEYRAENNPGEISRVLENSNQLVLQPVNLSLTGQRSDIDLNLAAQNVRSRTAEIIIDFGNFQNLPTERYRVAIDSGGATTLGFDELMMQRLNYAYTIADASFPANGTHYQGRGLTALRNVEMNSSTNSYWLIAHTFTPLNRPAGSRETEMYNILTDSYEASDIQLDKGDVLHLVYVTDTDLDGISDRLEQLAGTLIDNADSDGDTLDDALESYGWLTNLASAPCDEGSANELVRVFGDPLDSDSDNDTISDKDEFDACTNPKGNLRVSAGNNLVASRGSNVTLAAQVENFSDSSALTYRWEQIAGDSVGQLPNNASITR